MTTPRFRAYAYGKMREVTEIEWNVNGVYRVHVMPSVRKHYPTREYRNVNRLLAGEVDLLQYTGITRGEVKICEGDIVRTDLNIGSGFTDTPIYTGVVEWSPAGDWVMRAGALAQPIPELIRNKWQLEVIGNKFDNPDLLA